MLSCYAPLQESYCILERQTLSLELNRLKTKPATTNDTVPAFTQAIDSLFFLLHEAFSRWLVFTNGAAPPVFVELVSAVLLDFLDYGNTLLDLVRSEAQLDLPFIQSQSGARNLQHDSHDWRYFQAALQLQKSSEHFGKLLGEFEYALGDQIQRLWETQSSSVSSSAVFDASGRSGKKLLHAPFDTHQALCNALRSLAYDTMFSFIKNQLIVFPTLTDVWYGSASAVADERLQGPSLYLVEIREHIFALPARLEPFSIDPGFASEGSNQFIEQWVSIVSRGTMALYEQRICDLDVDQLSVDGAKQLSFDIQHLAHVLSVVKVELSAGLAAILARILARISEK